MTMNREIQYAIIRHLQDAELANEVVWMRDDISIDEKVKPFIVVENMQENDDMIAAGRKDYQEVYHYQISIRATSEDELNTLTALVKKALRQRITIYDLTLNPFAASGFLYVDVENIEPMRSDDITREVDNFRAHIDASVEIFVDESNGGGFTQ